MPGESLRIVERDGDVVRVVGGDVEVIAKMKLEGEELILDDLSIDGAGPGSLGPKRLREMARQFGAAQGAKVVRIRGTPRTTGANPGKKPREILINVI